VAVGSRSVVERLDSVANTVSDPRQKNSATARDKFTGRFSLEMPESSKRPKRLQTTMTA
jgi:hypothetical protein